MKQAAEYNMKSRCQRFSVQFFCLHGQPTLYLQSVFKVYISLALYVFDFLPPSSFFFSSSPVHPMWQGPLAVPGGDRQSPIDIIVRKSVFDSALKPLVTDYDPETCQQIWNNGYSFLVEYDDTTDKSSE